MRYAGPRLIFYPPIKQKMTILAIASFGLLIAFILVDVLPMRIFLIFIAICKYVYFIFVIKAIKESIVPKKHSL